MTGFYLHVPVGEPIAIVPYDEPTLDLALLQGKVGDSGWLEVLPLARGAERTIDLWCDEEGRLRQPGPRWNRMLPNGTPLAGSALVCASEGCESVPLTGEEAIRWAEILEGWPRL